MNEVVLVDTWMSIKEWEDAVGMGAFNDYDGFGFFSNIGESENDAMEVYASMIGEIVYEEVKKKYTHIVWYNV